MLDFNELKEKAKANFKANYWRCVAAAFILAALIGGTGTASANSANNSTESASGSASSSAGTLDPKAIMIILGIVISIVLIVILLASIPKIFAINPLNVGLHNFFLANSVSEGNAEITEVLVGFTPSYKRNVVTMLLKDLYVGLYCLLLIVPGIIKSYAYTLVPYILAEEPDLTSKEVLKKSEEMMDGHKMEYFKLMLSFFGWFLISIFTLGIVALFYVNPWVDCTKAEYYRYLKEQA